MPSAARPAPAPGHAVCKSGPDCADPMSIDRRILIADHNSEVRSGLAEFLSPIGLEIVEADNGLLALQIVRQGRIDLAVLDMHMPGHTGLELLDLFRREELEVPCIFCSAQASEDVLRMARDQGARAVLKKPIEPHVLRSEVTSILGLAS